MDTLKAQELDPTHPNLKELQKWLITITVDLKNKAGLEMQAGHQGDALWYLNHALSLDPEDWISLMKRSGSS